MSQINQVFPRLCHPLTKCSEVFFGSFRVWAFCCFIPLPSCGNQSF